MANASSNGYPRPDFQRSSLRWQSLNGPWDFLFDDLDVGISQHWHQTGLPAETVVNHSGITGTDDPKVSKVTEKIAALPEALLKDNVFTRRTDVKTYTKSVIQVPYVFQTQASGINDQDAHEVLWYERLISDIRSAEEREHGHRLLLRFGAVDYEATVWVDGAFVGSHRGGHVPFDIDISDAVRSGSSRPRITARVRDSPYDLTQPRGKQYWGPKPESIFYTPSSGIWQNVWLEVVPQTRIADSTHGTLLRSHDIQHGMLHATVAVQGAQVQVPLKVEIEAYLKGNLLATKDVTLPKNARRVNLDTSVRVDDETQNKLSDSIGRPNNQEAWLDGVALWSPDHPTLYDILISLYDTSSRMIDQVSTTIGMRSIEWLNEDRTFRLNGRPIFQALVLDQGYWPNTGMTPPAPEDLKTDIELALQMGFNGCRKHQKVEDPIFLYWADRLGFLVWGEAANAYEFDETYVERFDQEWMDSVRRDINHPCIVTWTPINESWGYPSLATSMEQRNHIRSLYYMTRTLDPTRPINDNCGWEHVCNDLTTFHDYADAPALKDVCRTMEGILGLKAGREMFVKPHLHDTGTKERSNAPILCTEFGGVNIAPAQGDQSGDLDWGYTTASDPEDLLRRVKALVMAIVDGGLCCGFVYTQLTDIEQEVNGLYTFDRKPKLEASKVKQIMEIAKERYFELLSGK